MSIEDRIEKALTDYCKNRDSMHIPPKDTDVDIVLTDCLFRIKDLKKQLARYQKAEQLIEQKVTGSLRHALAIVDDI